MSRTRTAGRVGSRRYGRHGRWVVVAVVLTVLGLPFTGRVLWVAYGPVGDDPVAQLRYLDAALGEGGGQDMQGLFPEGEFFSWALTGVAAGRVARDETRPAGDREFARGLAARALEALDNPAVADRFGLSATEYADGPGRLRYGVFYRGWRLSLLNEMATWDPAAATLATSEAAAILTAVDSSPSGWLESYPDQFWPCDTVVALAAAATTDPAAAEPVVARWLARTGAATDPATGLIAHRVDDTGRSTSGARATSSSLIVAFWPSLLDDPAPWSAYKKTFVTNRLGMTGALEYPPGTPAGAGDVDSGPLILGLSPVASAVTQAAARANGDTGLADQLNREIELLGMPWQPGNQRTYLFGQLLVAVAFFVWADTTALGGETEQSAPAAAWWALAAIPVVPAAAAWLMWALRPPAAKARRRL